MATPTSLARGLEGVIALESRICRIDGERGELVYSGYDIRDLARNVGFEEVVHLLWHGDLPDRDRLVDLKDRLAASRAIPPMVVEMIEAAPADTDPMTVLRTSISALAHFDPERDDPSPEANLRKAIRLVARTPGLVAAHDRIRRGRAPIAPRPDLSIASDFLWQLSGRVPGEAAERTFDACLVLHAEHGLNASTFAARVIGATLTDLYAAVTGAVGALAGPLHGGANIEVMSMLEEIRASGLDPAEWVKARLARKERIMGFGHRVYKTLDPRAAILRDMLERLSNERGSRTWFDLSKRILDTVVAEKGLQPNVDFYSASVYAMLDIPRDLFTPIFAISRMAGWTAHLLEQWADNRLIRPREAYVGPSDRSVPPISDRRPG